MCSLLSRSTSHFFKYPLSSYSIHISSFPSQYASEMSSKTLLSLIPRSTLLFSQQLLRKRIKQFWFKEILPYVYAMPNQTFTSKISFTLILFAFPDHQHLTRAWPNRWLMESEPFHGNAFILVPAVMASASFQPIQIFLNGIPGFWICKWAPMQMLEIPFNLRAMDILSSRNGGIKSKKKRWNWFHIKSTSAFDGCLPVNIKNIHLISNCIANCILCAHFKDAACYLESKR